jgi:hypothetical protein
MTHSFISINSLKHFACSLTCFYKFAAKLLVHLLLHNKGKYKLCMGVLASQQHLLQTTCQRGASYVVHRNGNHWAQDQEGKGCL